MLKVEFDYYIFYLVLCIITFSISMFVNSTPGRSKHLFPIIFITILSSIIGLRSSDIGTDTEVYVLIFNDIDGALIKSILNSFGKFASDPLFFTILFISSLIGSHSTALIMISFLTLFFGYLFCVRLCRILHLKNPLALLCCYLVSFYIFNQQINIIRAGLASTILLNYYLSVFKNKKKSAFCYGLLALGIHFSSFFGITLALAAKHLRIRNKMLLITYFAVLFLSFMNFGILDIRIERFLDLGKRTTIFLTSESESYVTGFRGGFALFNTIFLLFFYYFSPKIDLYSMIIRLFVYLSCLFFFCFQIPFFDRFGGFSWNLIAVLTFMSILKNRTSKESFALVSTFLLMIATSVGIELIH